MHPLWYTAGEGDKCGREGLCFCRGYRLIICSEYTLMDEVFLYLCINP